MVSPWGGDSSCLAFPATCSDLSARLGSGWLFYSEQRTPGVGEPFMDVSVGFGLGAPCVSFKVLAPPMPLGAGRHLFRLSGGERTAAPCPPRSSCSNKTLSPASRVEECILTELALDVCPAPPPPPPASRPLWSSGWKGCLWPRESAEWAELAGAVMSCQHPPGSRKREGVLVISFSTPYLPSPQGHEDRAGSWVLGPGPG